MLIVVLAIVFLNNKSVSNITNQSNRSMLLNTSINVLTFTQQRWGGLGLSPKGNIRVQMINGTFTVPTCYKNDNSTIADQGVSTWLGIGGNGTTLFQAGVICSINKSGSVYIPFYEVLNTTAEHNNPATLLNKFILINQGDIINVQLKLLNRTSNLWCLTLHDLTTQKTLHINFTDFPTSRLGNHVEWIAESLESNNVTFLSPFSPITFSNMSFEACNVSCVNYSFERATQNNTYVVDEYVINHTGVKTEISYFSGSKFIITYK
ncbi:MAG: G1 family glutamic endopeptidase [Nitrososphaeria archaeon]